MESEALVLFVGIRPCAFLSALTLFRYRNAPAGGRQLFAASLSRHTGIFGEMVPSDGFSGVAGALMSLVSASIAATRQIVLISVKAR